MGEILKSIDHPEGKTLKREAVFQETDQAKHVSVSRSGWISPQYNASRRVALDHKQLEDNRLIGLLPDSEDLGYYKVLRTRIQQRMRANGWSTLMVTSVHPGEGKTLTAINLAAMFAREFDQTVMLVDADLKAQSVHTTMGYESDKGLVDYLLGDCELQDIIVWPEVEKLTVISGGRLREAGTEVLNSPRMRALVEELKNRYTDRTLFFDVPPVLGRSDAMVFADFVDAIVLVVREGKTPLHDIQRVIEYLPKQKLLGYVMSQQ